MSLILEKDLPAPRLELRWYPSEESHYKDDKWYERRCEYLLVLPLKEHDIRREDEDGNKIYKENSILLNETLVRGGSGIPMNKDSIDLPYRDRAHAKWDSEVLNNLPIYAVCEGKAYLVED